ncbi:uncharacterized protein LOC129584218 [Paramacrobiotus metropolitanus]|uniref:uncharacterized protein LOC129584218 n=1 Tax=Paramacrobiotus metropolitanus TaxID=2943436 RepID=UPI002445716B|nr:uncharacterized protein LOC129584218 [Paramacrobiotus metropolitanus]
MDDAASDLCDALTDLLNLVFAGKVPKDVIPLLCGARLIALRKKDGGLRPIAVGNVYRRIAAKAVDIRIRTVTSEILQPHQLGSGVKRGVEGIIHGTRDFLLQYSGDVKALLKIDFTNAFNCVSRKEVLRIIADIIPEYYAFIKMCYGAHSSVFLGDAVISSQSGVQQGDPLGPVLFCLVLQFIVNKLNTYLNAWYTDAGTLGGSPSDVIRNFLLLIEKAKTIGLEVNIAKCEVFLCGGTEAQRTSAAYDFTNLFPGIAIVSADKLNLLGSSLLPAAVIPMINDKISQLGVMCGRLQLIPKHQALFLLKNCLGVPKIVHILRTSLAWMFPQELYRLDQVFREAVETITNVRMDHPTWLQACLPVRFGGLGIRRTEKLAFSAYLASASSLHQLISRLCPTLTATDVTVATRAWKLEADTDELPPEAFRHVQKAWDTPTTLQTFSRLTALRTSQEEVAHLKAVSVPEAGVWIHALSAACLGNLLEDNAFRISVALRLGAPIVTPHVCVCGGLVDELGRHGLRCKRSAGRLPRHDGISAKITRGLKSAGFPSRMEPKGLSVKDNKRPDVITLIPWNRGKPLAVDVTCVDTLAASYIDRTSVTVGAAAELAERES